MVTVIIPTYRRAEYIERAIYSILRQTYKDYEIIIVDDNNPNTEDRKKLEHIMNKYKDYSNIRYVKHEKNKNGAVARNTGIKLAKGKYITFLDDDDYFLKDRLEIMVNILESNKEYNGIYSSSLIKKGRYLDTLRYAERNGEFENEILKANSLIGTGSNLFFRAEALKEMNGFNEEFLRHQDYEVLVRFFDYGNKMINVNKILVIKDKSNGINVPDSRKSIEYREKYLNYFKNNILRYKDANDIFFENYIDLLRITLEDNNKEEFYYVLEKLKQFSKNEKLLNKKVKIIKLKFYAKKIPIINKINIILKSSKIRKKISKDIIREIEDVENYSKKIKNEDKVLNKTRKNMALKKIYDYIILNVVPKKIAHKILYYKKMGKKLNLKNPTDFNEKIQWLIVNEYGKNYAKYTDKIAVREYVKERGHEEILTQLYGTYKNSNEINFENLPDKFVLKTNHASQKVHICTDKNNFDIETCKKELNKELKENFAYKMLEYQYKYIKSQIMCEQYVEDGNNINPLDYKIYCCNGKPECILLCSDREHKLRVDYYDINWNYLEYSKEEYRSSMRHEKPKNLEKMLEIAKDLSKDFKFVRVDLYNVNGKIYFGELTFSPAAGTVRNCSQDALNYLGSKIKLPSDK